MLHRIGYDDVIISNETSAIQKSEKLILPGVGAFDQGVRNLQKLNIYKIIKDEVISKGKPILGICLGMQLLGRFSEEGSLEGLGLIPFDSIKFRLEAEKKEKEEYERLKKKYGN